MNRVSASLLALLPLGCHGTFDISKYIADDEADESQGDATDTRSETTLDETTLGESESTSDHTATESDTNSDATESTGDTAVDCGVDTVDIGNACIGVRQTIDVGAAPPTDLAVADFSNDGMLDLLTTTGQADIRLGGMNGMFEGAAVITGATGNALAVGDFQPDGHPDFLVVADTQLTFFTSLGDGSFTPLGEIAVAGGYDAVIADLDADNDGDVVVSGSSMRVYNNDGIWTLVVDAAAYPGEDLLLAQLDSDEDFDLAVARPEAALLSLFVNPGTGNFFAVPADFSIGGLTGIAAANLDGDDTPEMLALVAPNNALLVLDVQPNLETTQASIHTVGEEPQRVGVGDLDKDGLVDVVTSNAKTHDISLLLGDGTSLGDEIRVSDDAADVPGPIVIADLDDDGRREIIVGMSATNRIVVFGHVFNP